MEHASLVAQRVKRLPAMWALTLLFSHKVMSNSFVTLWIVAYQPALSIGFSRQEYWSGLPFPSPGDLPEPGIEPGSPTLQADVLPSEPPRKHVPFNCLLFLPISHSLV